MINDSEGILIGLYRESSSSKTVKKIDNFMVKELIFEDSKYILTEEKIDQSVIWKIFDDERELSREEIVNLFAFWNLKHQIKKH